MKKNILFILVLSTMLACNETEVVRPEKNDGAFESYENPDQRITGKMRSSSARTNVTGATLSLGFDSPVDAFGNVIVSSNGTTRVNFRVLILRNSASSDVHLQFQIRNSVQTPFWTSSVIRTLDFAPGQLEKTITGYFDITAANVGQGSYNLCLFVQDFIANAGSTGDCRNTEIGVTDLIISNKSVSSASVSPGQSISISATQKNQGTEKSWGSFIGYYLSMDANLGNDIYLGDKEVTTLNAGSSTTKILYTTIPTSLGPGSYYIIIFADYQQQDSESNENNNLASIPITVQ